MSTPQKAARPVEKTRRAVDIAVFALNIALSTLELPVSRDEKAVPPDERAVSATKKPCSADKLPMLGADERLRRLDVALSLSNFALPELQCLVRAAQGTVQSVARALHDAPTPVRAIK